MSIESTLLIGAFAGYAVAEAVALAGCLRRRRVERVVLALIAGGLALHFGSLSLRWVRLGHGPFATLFEILTSNVWSLLLVYAVSYWRVRIVRPAAPVVLGIVLMLVAWLLVVGNQEGHLPPTYRTLWLYLHVGFGKIFLGAVLVAVGIASLILLRARRAAADNHAMQANDIRLEALAFRFMALGFVFETLMLIAGGAWAQDAWGRYWAWDPLETWSFLTWLALAAYLHARVTLRIAPRLRAYAVIAVFVLAFLTFFGVPFVATAPHQGAV